MPTSSQSQILSVVDYELMRESLSNVNAPLSLAVNEMSSMEWKGERSLPPDNDQHSSNVAARQRTFSQVTDGKSTLIQPIEGEHRQISSLSIIE